jgi:hypothetical protein
MAIGARKADTASLGAADPLHQRLSAVAVRFVYQASPSETWERVPKVSLHVFGNRLRALAAHTWASNAGPRAETKRFRSTRSRVISSTLRRNHDSYRRRSSGPREHGLDESARFCAQPVLYSINPISEHQNPYEIPSAN